MGGPSVNWSLAHTAAKLLVLLPTVTSRYAQLIDVLNTHTAPWRVCHEAVHTMYSNN